jgi:cytochrome c5
MPTAVEVRMSSRLWWTRCARYAALAWSLTAVAACKGDDDDDRDHGTEEAAGDGGDHDHDANIQIGTPSGATCPENSDLTYDSFGKAFMDKYCIKCHSTELSGAARNGAPADHDFNVYEGIIGVAMHIDEYAASGPDSTNKTMPPASDSGPKPTMEEREKLGEWLACELDMLQ